MDIYLVGQEADSKLVVHARFTKAALAARLARRWQKALDRQGRYFDPLVVVYRQNISLSPIRFRHYQSIESRRSYITMLAD